MPRTFRFGFCRMASSRLSVSTEIGSLNFILFFWRSNSSSARRLVVLQPLKIRAGNKNQKTSLCRCFIKKFNPEMTGNLTKSQSKYIKSLQQKKYRERYGQFVIEGEKILKEALAEGGFVDYVVSTGAEIAVPDSFSGNHLFTD